MPRRFVLALDQGTTSSRAMVFNHRGQACATAQQEFPQHFPRPGWVEHNPEDLWETTRRVALAAVAEANLTGADLVALGLTNQRETTLLWDRATGKPLAPAIVWQDRRTADLCQKLKARKLEPLFRRKTGLRLDPYFSGTKLAWLLDHVPGARQRARRGELAFGTVDTWLLWKLTGGRVHATDVSNASRTLLLNLRTGKWDDELLRLLRIPRALLPVVRASSEVYGHVETIPALRGVPISGVAGDQQAALFGQACVQPGMAKNTYGTGCFLLLHTGEKPVVSRQPVPHHDRVATRTRRAAGVCAGGECVYRGRGGAMAAHDGLGHHRPSPPRSRHSPRASSVPDNGGVYLVRRVHRARRAALGRLCPRRDRRPHPLARRRSACRAAPRLESIAYQSADLLGAMEADAKIQAARVARRWRQATVNSALVQFQCDLLGVPVVRPRTTETTALGAAYLAGLAVGFWKNRAEIAALWGAGKKFLPQASRASTQKLQHDWRRAVTRAKAWVD